MFGPPCYGCDSEFDWVEGKDGEECRCGWPLKNRGKYEVRADVNDVPFRFGTFNNRAEALRVSKTIQGSYVLPRP